MKEITRIITVRITAVGEVSDESKIISREEVEEILKKDLDCDDVHVIDMQDFILDKEDKA